MAQKKLNEVSSPPTTAIGKFCEQIYTIHLQIFFILGYSSKNLYIFLGHENSGANIVSSISSNTSSITTSVTGSINSVIANSQSTSSGLREKSVGTPSEAHIPPLLGVAPLGPVHLSSEHKLQYERLQAAYFHMPHPSDSERFRLHFPRQPCQTPSYYPQVSNLI